MRPEKLLEELLKSINLEYLFIGSSAKEGSLKIEDGSLKVKRYDDWETFESIELSQNMIIDADRYVSFKRSGYYRNDFAVDNFYVLHKKTENYEWNFTLYVVDFIHFQLNFDNVNKEVIYNEKVIERDEWLAMLQFLEAILDRPEWRLKMRTSSFKLKGEGSLLDLIKSRGVFKKMGINVSA